MLPHEQPPHSLGGQLVATVHTRMVCSLACPHKTVPKAPTVLLIPLSDSVMSPELFHKTLFYKTQTQASVHPMKPQLTLPHWGPARAISCVLQAATGPQPTSHAVWGHGAIGLAA